MRCARSVSCGDAGVGVSTARADMLVRMTSAVAMVTPDAAAVLATRSVFETGSARSRISHVRDCSELRQLQNPLLGSTHRRTSTNRWPRASGPTRATDRRAANGSHRPALRAAAIESIRSVRLEPRDADALRHLQALENRAGTRIDSPQLALVALHGSVPQLAIDPRDTRDESVRLDRAKNRAGLRIDLMNLPSPIFADP